MEEQFYLAWPILFALFARRGRIEWIAWALVAGIMVVRVTTRIDIGGRLETRGLSIMLACAVALTTARRPGLMRPFERPAVQAAVVMFALACFLVPTALMTANRLDEESCHRLFVPPFAVAATLLIAMLWHASGSPIASALSWRPLAYVGRISYGVYLYHMAAHYLTWEVLLPGIDHWNRWPKFAARMLTTTALSLAIASLSYHLIERRFLAWKSRLR